ncbi:carboxypeptidase-like regulatory domain-containing protein [Zobellia nedashkovskayae]
MNFKYLLASLLFTIGQLSMAQNYNGKVLDGQNNSPLPEAHVTAQNGKATYTDADGNFQLSIPEKGTTVAISYMGYKTIQQFISPSDTVNQFLMEEEPFEVNGVMVTGNAKIIPYLPQ